MDVAGMRALQEDMAGTRGTIAQLEAQLQEVQSQEAALRCVVCGRPSLAGRHSRTHAHMHEPCMRCVLCINGGQMWEMPLPGRLSWLAGADDETSRLRLWWTGCLT